MLEDRALQIVSATTEVVSHALECWWTCRRANHNIVQNWIRVPQEHRVQQVERLRLELQLDAVH